MLLRLSLNQLVPQMTTGRIECVCVTVGQELVPGEKLFDVSVDLGSAFSQYCPPISYYRLVAREKATLRWLAVQEGDLCDLGSGLALLSTAQDDDIGLPPARAFKVAAASIIYHERMWSGAH